MKKIIAATSLTVGLAFLLTACSGNDTILKIGKDKITKENAYEDMMNAYGKDYLNKKIELLLLSQEATVSQKEVESGINALKTENNVKTKTELSKKIGISENNLSEEVEKRLLEEKVLAKKANLKEADIKERYEQTKYKMTLNYMPFDTSASAERALNLVRKGETLENASHKVKDDYYLSYVWNEVASDSSFPSEVLSVLSNLKVGEVSNIVKKDDGRYYLYEVKNRTVTPYSEEKGSIIRELSSEKGITIEKIYSDLRDKYKIEYPDKSVEQLLKDN